MTVLRPLVSVRRRVEQLARQATQGHCPGGHVRHRVSQVLGDEPAPEWPDAGAEARCVCGADPGNPDCTGTAYVLGDNLLSATADTIDGSTFFYNGDPVATRAINSARTLTTTGFLPCMENIRSEFVAPAVEVSLNQFMPPFEIVQ